MATIVSLINFKGGVGKTTITVEMAASLVHKFNEKVLIVDLDPQTNVSFSLLQETDWQIHVNKNGSLLNCFQNSLDGNPIVAVLLAALVLSEPLDARIAVAAAAILGGVAIVQSARTRAG